jgi:ABC-type multidrug transport system, ATPase component
MAPENQPHKYAIGLSTADSGKILIDGLDPVQAPAETRMRIGYIPENVNLYAYLTGLENLDYFCKLAGLKYSKIELENYLSICGLETKDHRKKGEWLLQRNASKSRDCHRLRETGNGLFVGRTCKRSGSSG